MSYAVATVGAMGTDVLDYREPGPLTRLGPVGAGLAAGIGADPVQICRAVQGLVIQPREAPAAGIPAERLAEKDIRPAGGLVAALAAVSPEPLHVPRAPERRVVGTCRHFSVLSCALLRLRGVPARARCGFGTYFEAGKALDHWIVEYRRGGRWVRVDTEYLDRGVVADPTDLAEGEFLTGGEAWQRYRAGAADPATFGVPGTEHAWGIGEIRGNAIRDLAALRAVEMLPWDEWGRMDDSYHGRTGPEFDALMDTVAAACAGDDPAAVENAYRSEDLAVPESMVA